MSARTKELVRLAAAYEGCTQIELIDRAVEQYLRVHQDEIMRRLADAKKTLTLN